MWNLLQIRMIFREFAFQLALQVVVLIILIICPIIFLYYENIYNNNYPLSYYLNSIIISISFLSLFLLIGTIFKFLRSGVRVNSYLMYNAMKLVHEVAHEARDSLTVMRINYQYIRDSNLPKDAAQEIVNLNNDLFKELVRSVADRAKSIIDSFHESHSNTVSIKLANTACPVDRHYYIDKVVYNSDARRERREEGKNARRANTGIREVYNSTIGNHSYYVRNNIKQKNSLPGYTRYNGGRDTWNTKYNNIIVVPIRFRRTNLEWISAYIANTTEKDKQVVLGYIQVDSKRSWFGSIDRQILSLLADLMYMIISSRFHMHQQFTGETDIDISSPMAWDEYFVNWYRAIAD